MKKLIDWSLPFFVLVLFLAIIGFGAFKNAHERQAAANKGMVCLNFKTFAPRIAQ